MNEGTLRAIHDAIREAEQALIDARVLFAKAETEVRRCEGALDALKAAREAATSTQPRAPQSSTGKKERFGWQEKILIIVGNEPGKYTKKELMAELRRCFPGQSEQGPSAAVYHAVNSGAIRISTDRCYLPSQVAK